MLHLRTVRLGRIRHRLAVRWVTVLALAGSLGLVSARIAGGAAAARADWGRTASVVVVTGEVEAGQPITEADVEHRSLPRAVIPDRAVIESPVGRVAIVDLYPGEVLVTGRVAPDGLSGAAALLPPGTRALAVPTGPGTPPLAVGDTVDVLAGFDPLLVVPSAEGTDPTGTEAVVPARPLVSGAAVVAVADGSVTVAVLAVDAPRVAFAVAQGAVTLALAGAG